MTEKIIELTEIGPDSYKMFLFPITFIEYKRRSHTFKTYLKANKILSFSNTILSYNINSINIQHI